MFRNTTDKLHVGTLLLKGGLISGAYMRGSTILRLLFLDAVLFFYNRHILISDFFFTRSDMLL